MELQPKTEPRCPPGFGSSSHRNLNEMSVSELVEELRTAFRVDVFDSIEEILVARDARLKTNIASLQEKIEVEKKGKILAEEELKKREEQYQKGKRARECYEKLLKEVKKSGLFDKNTIEELRNKHCELVAENCELNELKKKWLDDGNAVAELRIRIHELEDEVVELEAGKKNWEDEKSALDELRKRNYELEEAVKKNLAQNERSIIDELRAEKTTLLDEKGRLEALVESKERKFWELNGRVLKLEDDIKLLMSVDTNGGGRGNTQAGPQEPKDHNVGSDPLQRNEDTPHSLGAGTVQSSSKANKDNASATGRSGLETIIEIEDSDDDHHHRRQQKNLSRVQTIEMHKRKFSFADTSSSSSSSSSDLPLNFRDILSNKKSKT